MSFTESLEALVAENRSDLLSSHRSWARVRLGAICSVLNGCPFPSGSFVSGRGTPLLRIRDVGEASTETSYDGDFDPTYLVEPGELVVGMDGDFRAALWRGPRALLNQRVCKLSPREEFYSPRLLAHAIPGYLDAINAKTSAITVKHLSSRTVEDIPLPLPPRSEQDRIAERLEMMLGDLDHAVALLERVEQNIKRYRASVLKAAVEGRLVPTEAELARREGREYGPASELLKRILAERKARWIEDAAGKARAKAEEKARKAGQSWTAKDNAAILEKERAKVAKRYKEPAAPDTTDLPDLPEGWCWAGLRQLCSAAPNALKAGPFGSSLKKECYVAEGYKIYGQEQVLRQDPFYGDYFIDEEKYLSLESCAVSPGDLLISLVGTIGRTLLLPTGIKPGIINPRLIKITLDPSVVLGEFVQIYLQSPSAKEVFALASHGGTMEILNMAILTELAFPLPPLSEQQAILSAVDGALTVGDRAQENAKGVARRTTHLRQSILKWAFEGKLVEQDPDDEPASVLLERINAERAGAASPKARRSKKRSAE